VAPPIGYDGSTPHALVLGFHGSGATGETLRSHLDLEKWASGSAIFIYPDGLEVSGGGTGWFLGKNGRDVRFVDAVVEDAETKYCVDPGAVFAVGFSYGGWMVNALACARPGMLRGIASIAGGGPLDACAAGVAAVIVHGIGDFDEPVMSGEESRDRWLGANACLGKSDAAALASCVRYQGCAPDRPLLWCRHDGGHEVPPFAPEAIWSFFQSLR
jgi:polyhydroxybutyrate depolymerase